MLSALFPAIRQPITGEVRLLEYQVLNSLPADLLGLDASQLHTRLKGPTLIHIAGRNPQPLFVSVLQHGNEMTGWEAMRMLLSQHQGAQLPRSLLLFIANVDAAKHELRHLENQADFNRCWPGAHDADTPVHLMLARLTESMFSHNLFASLDIHNNSGRNPHYAAMTHLRPQWLQLASLFDRKAVYFQQPAGVQCDAFSAFCPAITLECGVAHQAGGTTHCCEYVQTVMARESLPQHLTAAVNLQLFHTVARVTIDPELDFEFGQPDAAVNFDASLDRFNFQEIQAGQVLAHYDDRPVEGALCATDDRGRNLSHRYLEFGHGTIRARRNFIPSMLCNDSRIVRQDCLFYIMEELELPAASTGATVEELFSESRSFITKFTRN